MAITTKKKAAASTATSEDCERLIATSLEQSDTLAASIRTELQQIAFCQATITTLQSELAQRMRDREAIQRQLQAIQQTVTDARAQVSHSVGAAAQSTMTTLLAAEQDAQNAQQQLDTMLREHATADQVAQSGITEQQRSITDRERHVYQLENELRVIGETRQQYLVQLGESLHRQAIQRLSHLTTRAQASEDQHIATKHDLAIARREEDQKLGAGRDYARTFDVPMPLVKMPRQQPWLCSYTSSIRLSGTIRRLNTRALACPPVSTRYLTSLPLIPTTCEPWLQPAIPHHYYSKKSG